MFVKRWLTVFVLVLGCGEACPSGQLDCDGRCVDVSSDPRNCGACGAQCLGAQACVDGLCGCPAGTESCGGDCVTLEDDSAHCGACFTACPSGAECSAGACACLGDASVCDDACVSLEDDAQNCGACGNACGSAQACVAGRCGCADAALRACGEECVQTDVDARHCGGCGNVCGAPRSCTGGACVCNAGQTFCSGNCVDLTGDPRHCGSCGNGCAGSASCLDGRCVPQLRWADDHASGGSMTVGPFDWDGRVAVAADGSVYLGYSRPGGNVTLVAYSPGGTVRWTRTMTTTASRVGDVAVVDGGVVITASYRFSWSTPGGRFVGSGGSDDVAVVAFDSAGTTRWDYFVQSSGLERTGGLGAGGGRVSVGGSLAGTFDFGGGPLTGDTFRDAFVLLLDASTGAYVNAVIGAGIGSIRPVFTEIAPDGDVIVGGFAGAGVNFGGGATSGVNGGFLARLRPDLSHRWSRQVTASEVFGVAVDTAGDVYLSGEVTRTTDWGGGATLTVPSREDGTFLLAVDGATGNSRWASGVTGDFLDLGRGPVVDGAGRIWVGASAPGGLGGNDAVLVAHRASDGAILLIEPFGSDMRDLACGIAANGTHLAFAGRFSGTARFGTSTFTATDFDVFVSLFSL